MAEPISAAVLMSLEKRQKVLEREYSSYDYEKVFWNTVYGVGLVGVGWVAIKTGKAIADIQGLWDKDKITQGEYDKLVRYVEGRNKNTDPYAVWIWDNLGMAKDMKESIVYYRENPAEWENFKDGYEASGGESGTIRVLNFIDGVYSSYGAVLPVGILSYNCITEYIRVKRLRGELNGGA